MDMKVSFDQTPGASPIYECGDGEALTWDWEKEAWVDARVGRRRQRVHGLDAIGEPRTIIPAVADAVLELADIREGGGLLLSWYWDSGRIVVALIWSEEGVMGAFREKGEGPSQDWPEWWPARSVDRGLLTAIQVSLS